MLYLILVLLLCAGFLFWQSARQRKAARLPGGRVIYTDMGDWNKVRKPLYDPNLELVGKPDYLIERKGKIIPVEVKSGKAPRAPYDSHIYQAAAYCYLVERAYGKRPPYGIIHYEDRDFAINYTSQLESSLLDIVIAMQNDAIRNRELARSHEQAARCRGCGFREACNDQIL